LPDGAAPVQLENITVNIRPRNPWEAMDLGLALVRDNWKVLLAPWLLISGGIFAALHLLLLNKPLVAILLFWWLKPFFDRVLLHIYSHTLFGTQPTLQQTLNALPQLFRTGLWTNLTFLRFNIFRSFHLPVWQLEGLRGKERRERLTVISGRSNAYAMALTIVCLLLEMLLYLSFILLLLLFIPEDLDFDISILWGDDTDVWWSITDSLFYYPAFAIIEPLYVAAGFMLYINRRTQLEGWDIELAFRRLRNRLDKFTATTLATLLFASVCLTLVFPADLYAEEPVVSEEPVAEIPLVASESRNVINEVMKREEFSQVKKIQHWMPIERKQEEIEEPTWMKRLKQYLENYDRLFEWIATSFRALLWFLLLLLLGLIWVFRDRWLGLFIRGKRKVADYQPPAQLFGLEVAPESLPDDIAAAARILFQQGDIRGAAGLLYRGALSVLIHQDHLALESSHTEGDVLHLANARLVSTRREYLKRLTSLWQQIAYAHRQPDAITAQALCDDWPQFEALS
jgi:hypothetical protein